MKEVKLEGRHDLSAGKEFGNQVVAYRTRYETLLNALGATCTEVVRDRMLEIDLDIYPKRFVRNAVHAFIFPPQPDAPRRESSNEIEGTQPYTITRERIEVDYDKEAVKGKVTVTYDDAGNAPVLTFQDKLPEGSELPSVTQSAVAMWTREVEVAQ